VKLKQRPSEPEVVRLPDPALPYGRLIGSAH
jgi:hypothetical protein